MLGGLRIQSGEQVVTRFRTRSVDSIFAYLALNLGKDVRREKLIALEWPDSDSLQGQQNLRTALTSIRSTLGSEVIAADRATVRLVEDFFEIDVITFRKAGYTALYKGRFLDGLDSNWIQSEAVQLEEHYIRVIVEKLETLERAESVTLINEALLKVPSSVLLRAKLRHLGHIGVPKQARATPYLVNSFIGRERELSDLTHLIKSIRLVTLTGLGGIGKTRLAAELWNRNLPDAWFISLAELSDASFIGEALRQGLRLPPSSRMPGLEQVLDVLEDENGLLVLDNFEHILPAVSVVERLLMQCPRLRVVVTSRVGLGLEGEAEYQVGPLGLSSGEGGSFSESVQLFEARARAVGPNFAVTKKNFQSVSELCVRLDGFPLALEFAAAKSRIFSPSEMVEQLDDRFEFLVQKASGHDRRQMSLLEALDWSFDRLPAADQHLLCRLSIFDGGFTHDAVERVCKATQSGSQVESLCAAAWIERSSDPGPSRFRLLESVRDYAALLLPPRDRDKTSRAHASYYLELSEKCLAASFMPAEPILHGLVQMDIHNLDTAWLWLKRHDAEGALRMVCSLNWYWILSGLSPVGELRVKEAIANVDTAPRTILARAYHHCGNFIMFQGRYAEAEVWLRQAYEIDTGIKSDPLSIGLSASQVARVLSELGRVHEVKPWLGVAIENLKTVGDDNWLCAGYTIFSLAANREGDFESAIEAGCRAVDHGRRGGYQWGLASCLNELAMGYHLSRNFDDSIIHQLESISIKRELSALPSLALSLSDLGATYLVSGNIIEAREAVRACAVTLLELNDLDILPRLFATAAELLWIEGNNDLSTRALAKMVSLTRGRTMNAGETEARERALLLIGDAGLSQALDTNSRLIIEALAAL